MLSARLSFVVLVGTASAFAPFSAAQAVSFLGLEVAEAVAAPVAAPPTAPVPVPSGSTLTAVPPAPASVVPATPRPTYVGTDPSAHHHFNQHVVNPTNRNACGTTSLSMILADEGCIGSALGDAQAVDRTVRPWGGFSAPADLRQYAGRLGLSSRARNSASVADLEERLRAGNRIQVMVDGGGSPHWIAVLGMATDPVTGATTIVVADPGDHAPRRMSQADFETIWAAPMRSAAGAFVNDLAGYHNYMICYDRNAADLPWAGNWGIAATENAAGGVSDVCNGGVNLTQGRVGTAIGQLTGGTVRTVTAVPGAVGAVVDTAGSRTLDYAGGRWQAGGLGNRTLAVGAYAVGGTMRGVGSTVEFVGNGVSAAGGWVGDGLEWTGTTIDGAARGLWNWVTGS